MLGPPRSSMYLQTSNNTNFNNGVAPRYVNYPHHQKDMSSPKSKDNNIFSSNSNNISKDVYSFNNTNTKNFTFDNNANGDRSPSFLSQDSHSHQGTPEIFESAGSGDRKSRKNTREKQRRSELNEQFENLCVLLGLNKKSEKYSVMAEAINTIQALRGSVEELTLLNTALRNEVNNITFASSRSASYASGAGRHDSFMTPMAPMSSTANRLGSVTNIHSPLGGFRMPNDVDPNNRRGSMPTMAQTRFDNNDMPQDTGKMMDEDVRQGVHQHQQIGQTEQPRPPFPVPSAVDYSYSALLDHRRSSLGQINQFQKYLFEKANAHIPVPPPEPNQIFK